MPWCSCNVAVTIFVFWFEMPWRSCSVAVMTFAFLGRGNIGGWTQGDRCRCGSPADCVTGLLGDAGARIRGAKNKSDKFARKILWSCETHGWLPMFAWSCRHTWQWYVLHMHPTSQSQNTNPPDSKVHGAYMGPTWGRQDPSGPHVGPMNFAIRDNMMTSSNGNIFRVTGPLWGEFTGHPVNSPHKDQWRELCFLWSAPKQTVE